MQEWEERAGCKEGEALCDIYGGGQGLTLKEDKSEADNIGEGDWVRVEDEEEGRTERRQEAEEVKAWTGYYLICRAAEEEAQYHERDKCLKVENNEWDDVKRGVTIIEQEMFKKRRFKKYSKCFYYGIPQALCDQ
ncbi:hypothetical protein QBC46DRAFT_398483 [Diplogelasinospora grovesii]|uniref:Uncharacterized protein n=1 Tax=Diplogelasinospora grovesii TaxID=303347 RepID=A0AAN6MWY2_9PEZI|nr:hypothetical protein QBC46DRAFT_398483 [Diplogelasinospora grovesii]